MNPAPSANPAEALELARWLTSSDAEPYLAAAAASERTSPQFVQSLRGQLTSEQVRAILEMAALRERAADKFPWPERLFFTAKGLEQATDWRLARYKAATAFHRLPGVSAFDLGCGIGGDLLALAMVGSTIAIERDSVSAEFARANLQNCWPYSRTAQLHVQSQVRCDDLTNIKLPRDSFWHLDPDRRPVGARAVHWEWLEPGPAVIASLIQRQPNAVIKGAPAAPAPTTELGDYSREWVSTRRECRQQLLWLGALAENQELHRATRIIDAETAALYPQRSSDMLRSTSIDDPWQPSVAYSFQGRPGQTSETTPIWGTYLYEPDPAVLAADLAGDLAQILCWTQLETSIPYFTSNILSLHPLWSSFRIEAVLPWRRERVKSLLRERQIGQLEIKKRGVPLDPAEVRQQLQLRGENSAVLILTRQGKQIQALFCARVTAG
jgi:hypothetical protein